MATESEAAETRVMLTVRVKPSAVAQLDRLAVRVGVRRSDLIRQLLAEGIKAQNAKLDANEKWSARQRGKR